MNISIIGPTEAGKTVYLAGLVRAALAFDDMSRRVRVRPNAENIPSLELDRVATQILTGNLPGATTKSQDYSLFVDLPGSILFDWGADEGIAVTMIDQPGGDCFPSAEEQFSDAVRENLKRADCILLMLPSDFRSVPLDLVDRMKNFTAVAREVKATKVGQKPFVRMAVCLSKVDLLFADRGRAAFEAIEQEDARNYIQRYLGFDVGQQFFDALGCAVPIGGCWFSLVSVYGFIRSTGEAASVEESDGVSKYKHSGAGADVDWCPYNLLEPMEFLIRGMCWQEKTTL